MNRLLKAKMIEHYGSQWEFSKALGIHESFVSKIVTGARILSSEDQKKWADLLQSEVSELFTEDA